MAGILTNGGKEIVRSIKTCYFLFSMISWATLDGTTS